MHYHLAQCNIVKLRAPLDSPVVAGFVAALDPVNAIADAAPGFVWRLKTEDGDATAIRAFDDDLILVNMSVWESIDALVAYTYDSGHREVLRHRRDWSEGIDRSHLVLWWVPVGTVPEVGDAVARLAQLDRDGPTLEAFTLRHRFDPPAPSAEAATRTG